MKSVYCLVTIVSTLATLAAGRVTLEVPGYATVIGGYGPSFVQGRRYSFFHGMYYAEPPTGERRFLPPVPKSYSPGTILDAWIQYPGCPQSGGSEDCLIVNVHTPKLPGNASDPNTSYDDLLPVMFWIHGGSFTSGANNFYTGYKWMDYDVVIVEVQYRLSALGFLSLDIDEVPGNAGMFDMLEALKWTQKYVKYFGGDPNCVTIFGESAGAASVSFLLLVPQARGLFHRAIAQSGSMLADWALDARALQNGRSIVEETGCPMEPKEDMVACLRTIPAQQLIQAEGRANGKDRKNGGLGFGGCSPVIQKAGVEKLLTEEPIKLIEAGAYATDVPIMFGANQEEGIFVLGVLLGDYIRPNDLEFDEDFMTHGMIPAILNALGSRDDTGAIAKTLERKYLTGLQLGNFTEMMPGLIDICSVFFLKAGGYNTVMKHSAFNPNAYWYSYDFRGRIMLLSAPKPIPKGINHADEMLNFWGPVPSPIFNLTEITLSKRMLQLWTTFAKYGNPTPDGVEMLEGIPKFEPWTLEKKSFMSINADWELQSDYTATYTVMGDPYRQQKLSEDAKPKYQPPQTFRRYV